MHMRVKDDLIIKFKSTYDETPLPDKEAFYSSLTMENITDIDYRHTERAFRKFKLKKLGQYNDIYV